MRRLVANAVLLGLALAVAVALGEIALRVAGVGYPQFYQPDPVRGAAHRPGASGWYRREGEAFVRINAAGFRDREHQMKKPPDTLRIAFLGDSYAEAMQVDQDQTFWAVTERELARCPALAGTAIEALNLGVSGYGTGQQLQTLRDRAWGYDPDLVVLAFLTGNDLRNNVRELEKNEAQPYFVVRDGHLELDDSFLRSAGWARTQTPLWRAKQWLLERFRIVQLAYEIRVIRQRERQVAAQRGVDDPVYAPPQSEAWKSAWDVTERLIRTLRDEVVARGARFHLMILTNASQVHPDPAVRAEKARALGVDDLLYPSRRIEAFARSEGIPVLALVEPFRAEAEARGVCLHGFPNAVPCGGHWNAEAHHLAGELLAAHLCSHAALAGDRRR